MKVIAINSAKSHPNSQKNNSKGSETSASISCDNKNYITKNVVANFISFLGEDATLEKYTAQLDEIGYTQYMQENFQEALKTQQKAVDTLKESTTASKEQAREKKKALMELYSDMGFAYSNLNIDDLSELAYFKAFMIVQDLFHNDNGLSDEQRMFLRNRSNLYLKNLDSFFEESGNVDGQIFCRLNWDDFLDKNKNTNVDFTMVNPEAQRRADSFYQKMYNRSQKI